MAAPPPGAPAPGRARRLVWSGVPPLPFGGGGSAAGCGSVCRGGGANCATGCMGRRRAACSLAFAGTGGAAAAAGRAHNTAAAGRTARTARPSATAANAAAFGAAAVGPGRETASAGAAEGQTPAASDSCRGDSYRAAAAARVALAAAGWDWASALASSRTVVRPNSVRPKSDRTTELPNFSDAPCNRRDASTASTPCALFCARKKYATPDAHAHTTMPTNMCPDHVQRRTNVRRPRLTRTVLCPLSLQCTLSPFPPVHALTRGRSTR